MIWKKYDQKPVEFLCFEKRMPAQSEAFQELINQ